MVSRRCFLQQSLAAVAALAAGPDSAKGEPAGAPAGKLGRDRFGSLSYSFAIRARQDPALADPVVFARFCRDQGFGGVQVSLRARDMQECRAVRRELERLEVYAEGIIGLPTDPSDAQRFEAELKTARECGATVLRTVMLGGRRYESFQTAEQFQAFRARSVKSLHLAEPLVARHDLRLAVENHKDFRVDEFLDILEEIGSESLGVCLDTGNNLALLDDPWQVIDRLADRTFTVHLKDMAVEEYEDGFLLAEVPLGTGLLDLPRVIGRVAQASPVARFNLEMITRDPLRIPCLTDAYWATFPKVAGLALAQTLRLVKQQARPGGSLPRMTGRATRDQVVQEQLHVTQSVDYARRALGLPAV